MFERISSKYRARSILKVILRELDFFENNSSVSGELVTKLFDRWASFPNYRKDGYPRKNCNWYNGWYMFGTIWNVVKHSGGPYAVLYMPHQQMKDLVNEDLQHFDHSGFELNNFLKDGKITILGESIFREMSRASIYGINSVILFDPYKE